MRVMPHTNTSILYKPIPRDSNMIRSWIIMYMVTCVYSCQVGTYNVSDGSCKACPANSWSVAGEACTANTGYYDLGHDLIAYYSFNPSDMLADSAGVTGRLINIGAVTYAADSSSAPLTGWSDGRQNVAYLAQPGGMEDGNSQMQFLAMPAITMPSSLSICLWYFLTDSACGQPSVIDIGNGRYMNNIMITRNGLGMDGTVTVVTSATLGIIQTGAIQQAYTRANWYINTWNHICATISDTTLTTYVNGGIGYPVAMPSVYPGAYYAPGNSRIGRSWMIGYNLFRGYIDEIRIYKRVIKLSEAQAIYNFRGDTNTPVMPMACPRCGSSMYATTPCTSDGYTCAQCSICPIGTYIHTPCTNFSNTICANCSICSAGNAYQTKACTASADTACSACTACTAGITYQLTACTTSADTVCACVPGMTYQSSPHTCIPCTTCATGNYSKIVCNGSVDTVCDVCASNHYCNQSLSTLCPNGTFSLPGASSVSQCSCPTDASAGSECACNPGFQTTMNALALGGWQCTPCGHGTFASMPGALQCDICPVDHFCNTTSSVPCPNGTRSMPGHSECIVILTASDCSPGTYLTSNKCLPCPANTWSLKGVCVANAGYYNLGDSVQAYYSFNPSDLLADISGISGSMANIGGVTYANDSFISPLTGWYAGMQNVASFSPRQHLTLPDTNISSSFSICLWYFATKDMYQASLIDLGHGFITDNIQISKADQVNGLISMKNPADNIYAYVIQRNAWSINKWTHMCMSVHDGIQTYLNGVASESTPIAGKFPGAFYAAGTGLIGNTYGVTDGFKGYMDEIRIFNRSITALEVKAIYEFRGDTNSSFLIAACCPNGSYAITNCTSTGAVCIACTNGCASGTYQTTACTPYSDIVCSACSLCAPGRTRLRSPCTPFTDTVCTDESTINNGYYNLGYSMLAYYPFNPSSFLADISGMNGDLTNHGNVGSAADSSSSPLTGWSDGSQNVAYLSQPGTLDSADPHIQYLTMPAITIHQTFSMCAWYWPSSVGSGNNAAVIDIGNGPTFQRYYQYYHVCALINHGNWGIIQINNGWIHNTWNHLCISVSQTTMQVFLNGAGTGSVILQTPFPGIVGNGFIGKSSISDVQHQTFRGYIDEIRIFNRSITSTEVQLIYNYRGYTNTPVLWAPCSDCSLGQYQAAPCTPTSDIICPACTVCSTGTFTYTKCASAADTVCSPCSACTSGSTYKTDDCTIDTDTKCTPCTVCPSFTIQSCTNLSDTVCLNCSAGTLFTGTKCIKCTPGSYSVNANITNCTLCDAGTFASQAGASSCTACAANSFSNTSASTSCHTCSICKSGTYQTTPCNSTSDTVCGPCASCTTYLFSICTPLANTVCTDHPVVKDGYYNLGYDMLAYYPFNPSNFLSDMSAMTGDLMNYGNVRYATDSSSSPLTGWSDGSQNVAYLSQPGTLDSSDPHIQYLAMPAITIPQTFSMCTWYWPSSVGSGNNAAVIDIVNGPAFQICMQ